ncbi:putative metallophosphatase family protein [Paratrimastix pyriformis]|uniref:Metallophosphatase family protein n=1 Tax=Paratrimastix pyriformis TaxID=342808 RepID=A0ABQ8URE5_9EUKA|nr:putative metallophosphatase family protein [Paratrimastix pyriformis]
MHFYFSDMNLSRDAFLRDQIKEDGWISTSVFASFKRISRLTMDTAAIVDAVQGSELIETNASGTAFRRRGALPPLAVERRAIKAASQTTFQQAPAVAAVPVAPAPSGVLRVLVITDTHGDLDRINVLAERENVQAVLHCGDFGFYTAESLDSIEERELHLIVKHSHDFSAPQKAEAAKLFRDGGGLRAWMRRQPFHLSTLPDYLAGTKQFKVRPAAHCPSTSCPAPCPSLPSGATTTTGVIAAGRVPNPHLVDHNAFFRVGRLCVYGLGGNFLPSDSLSPRWHPLGASWGRASPGRAGKVWTTFTEIGGLIQTVKNAPRNAGDVSVFLTHCSPAICPSLSLLGRTLQPDLCFSGHMGPYYAHSWNNAAVRDTAACLRWLASDVGLFAGDLDPQQSPPAATRTAPAPAPAPAPASGATTLPAGPVTTVVAPAPGAAPTAPAPSPPRPPAGPAGLLPAPAEPGDAGRVLPTDPVHWWRARHPGGQPVFPTEAACVEAALDMFRGIRREASAPAPAGTGDRRPPMPQWMFRPNYYNLPDAPNGYAVIEVPPTGWARVNTISTLER